ncbi:MAG: hypothetical protein HPY65_07745 [Syntrophaceae bacterium]|nr:hypothetical protein [Syntrophaceae bacterium]
MGNFFTALTAETLWKYTHMNIPFNELDKAITYLKNVIVSCDGAISWNASTGTLSWSGAIRIHFNTAAGNLVQNTIAAGSIALTDGQFAYVDLNESDGTALTVSAGSITTGAASNILAYNRLVLGYRNAASDDFYPVYLNAPIKYSTSATVNTGTATDEAVTPDALAGSNLGTKEIYFQVVAPTTDCAQYAFAMSSPIPSSLAGMNLVGVLAGVGTQPGTTGTMAVTLGRNRPVTLGDSTTQFDITRPGAPDANTTRYTYDGTGTDPGISSSAASLQVNDGISIQAQNFAAGNNGFKSITAVGANYFETTDAGSSAEANKTIGTGSIVVTKNRGMLSTMVSIDSLEFTSKTAETPAVINTDYDDIAEGDTLNAVILTVHSGTVAKGLGITAIFRLP